MGQTASALGEWVNCDLAGKCLTPGVQQEQTNYTYPPCAPGWLPGQWYQYSDEKGTHTALAPPACVCAPTAGSWGTQSPDMKKISDGVGGYSCQCNDETKGYQAGGVCTGCPGGLIRCDGTCGPPDVIAEDNLHWDGKTKNGNKVIVSFKKDDVCKGQVCQCGKGDKPVVDAATGKCACESACQPGSIYPPETSASADPTLMDAKFCQVCPANQKAVQNEKNTSDSGLAFETVDKCRPCASDEKSSPGSAQCVKLSCPSGSLAKNHQCIKCAGGKCAVLGEKPDPPKGPPPLRKNVVITCPPGMEMKKGKCRFPEAEIGQPSFPGRKNIDDVVTNPAGVRGKRDFTTGVTAPVQDNRIKGTPASVRNPSSGLTGTPALVRTPSTTTGTPALVRTPTPVTGTPALTRPPTISTPPTMIAPPSAPTFNRK